MLKSLLERSDVVLNSMDQYDRTRLLRFAAQGSETIVSCCLARDDIVVDSTDASGRPPRKMDMKQW